MEITRGRVINVDLARSVPRARVEVTAVPSCARCAAGKGCGAGLLGQSAATRCIDALIGAGISVDEGDDVRIALAPENLLRASWLVYGLPLLGGVGAAGLAYFAGSSDLAAVLALLVGMAAGLGTARKRLRNSACLRQFTPTIVERLSVPK